MVVWQGYPEKLSQPTLDFFCFLLDQLAADE